MVTSIQLGNISQQNGKTVVTGSSSGGLDTEALIEDLTKAKRLPATQLEERIDQNTKTSAAYSELKNILTTFRDAADFLRNPPGFQNDDENIFEYRTASVSNDGALAGSNFLSVTAEPGADVSSYDVTVDQRATFNVKQTNTFSLTDTNADSVINADDQAVGAGFPLAAGTISVGASGETVTLNDGDSLNQVAAKINAVSDQSQVAATIIQVAPGDFRLSLKTTETGAALNYASPALGVGYAQETDALDAQFTIDGTTITRSSNSVDDVIDGLTFNLLQETPVGDTLTVNLQPDTELVKEAIFSFVDAYNEFRIFEAKQSEIGEDGLPTEDALLASDTTLRTVTTRVNNEITGIVEGITSGPNQLAQLGITFNDFPGDEETPEVRNILNVDEAALDSALATDFNGVRQVFEFDAVSDNPNLAVFSRTNALDATSIDLNIDQTNGIYEATFDNGGGPTTVTLDATPITTGTGVILEGQEGTELEGLVLIFSSPNDATVNLDLTQGIGDRLYNTIDTLLDKDTGAVAVEQENISETNTRLQDEIRRIDEMVERFRQQLLREFSALESAISEANVLLQTLKAQSDARIAASG